ncbi:MAG: DUF3320 domain-containing protein [Microthrixaceae bacterium]
MDERHETLQGRLGQRVSEQIADWRDDLINLSRMNRLLYFKPATTATLEVTSPMSSPVIARLDASGSQDWWDFYLPDDPDPELTLPTDWAPKQASATELVVADKDTKAIKSTLRALERRTNQEFVDKGIWVLYLAVGMLEWVDPDDGAKVASPLLLVPVTLSRSSLSQPFRLRRTDDDAVINPALAVKLAATFEIELPTIDDLTQQTFKGIVDAIAPLITDRPGWSFHDRLVVSTFTFHKEAMYRDLLDNEGIVASHPLVQVLALGPDAPNHGSLDFEPILDEDLDERTGPTRIRAVLDADSSQRRAIAAAADGHSFVMDGPPGTGKSQTITNIIAELMSAGRTVLFVSEKAAALEVVFNRLRETRLDEFALQLHSHKATRKSVAQQLGASLDARPTARGSLTPEDLARVDRHRDALTGYAVALNAVRAPLNQSMHDVLGRLAQLHAAREAPVPSAITSSLTPADFVAIREATSSLSRAWGPVAQGDRFVWRDVQDSTLSAARKVGLERLMAEATTALDEVAAAAEAIDEDLGLGWATSVADAERLHDLLLVLQEIHHHVPLDWFTSEALDDVEQRAARISGQLESHRGQVAAIVEQAGPLWHGLQASRAASTVEARKRLADAAVPLALADVTTLGLVEQLLVLTAGTASFADAARAEVGVLTEAFGASSAEISIDRGAQLASLVEYVGSITPPEATWLDPILQPRLLEAARVLGELLTDHRQRHERLSATFRPSVLALDLPALTSRFTDVHKGLKKLGGAYRADRATLVEHLVSGKFDKAVVELLPEAVAWQQLDRRLSQAESRHAGVLGPHYYTRDGADFDAIAKAIDIAQRVVAVAGDQLDPGQVAAQVGLNGHPDPAVVAAGRRLAELIDAWATTVEQTWPGASASLRRLTADELASWCEAFRGPLEGLGEAFTDAVPILGPEVNLGRLIEALETRAAIEESTEEIDRHRATDEVLLGHLFSGLDTDLTALREAINWAVEVRAVVGRPTSRRGAQALLNMARPAELLGAPLADWRKHAHAIAEQFAPERSDEVAAELRSDFGDVRLLVSDLARNVADIEEWAQYTRSCEALRELGAEPAVSFCIDERVTADEIGPIVERAVLTAWVDSVVASDRRVEPHRAADRDALVAGYRNLDQRAVSEASAEVINRCTARRPTSIAGAGGIIQREAAKKKRHMPIRRLLDQAGAVAQELKPCFMMSPLAVSQFLPPSMRFDVVIFDEASQVRPCDAVNCIYRGDQLIVAGDQQQLPPSSFFSVSDGSDDVYDDEEIEIYESVLDLCKGTGSLRSLSLNWHYRSEHESLITYSNFGFYGGRLWTFPGAVHDAPDVGIEVMRVDGVYRRGKAAANDNIVEAETVVDRVLFHRREHPNLSLGVVTFSAKQADAVHTALEARAVREPLLAGLLNEDRLHGFFVKNLENVQGDERDIMIFTIGYGPDEAGNFTLNLGPLNLAGGYRRLNVAITRAKRRVEIVTSISASQLESSAAEGVRHLAGYLRFAERGGDELTHLVELPSLREAEPPLNTEVRDVLERWGFEVVPQVGLAGYRVDLGIVDPDRPGSYLMGLELDGPNYHSSLVARDRDRLRQSVLEGLGWRLLRIWSLAWFRDRHGQEVRLRRALDAAIGRTADPEAAVDEPVAGVVVDHGEADWDAPPGWTVPYRVARLGQPLTALSIKDRNAWPALNKMLTELVVQEGPIHQRVVFRRIVEAWGVNATVTAQSVVYDAMRQASRMSLRLDDSGFLSMPDQDLSIVRVPTTDPRSERKLEDISPQEVDKALTLAVQDAHSIDEDDLSMYVARVFGWRRRTAQVIDGLEQAIERLVTRGVLERDGVQLRLAR